MTLRIFSDLDNMNQGRQSVPHSFSDSIPRELCQHHDEADQRQFRGDSQRGADTGLGSGQEQRRESETSLVRMSEGEAREQ